MNQGMQRLADQFQGVVIAEQAQPGRIDEQAVSRPINPEHALGHGLKQQAKPLLTLSERLLHGPARTDIRERDDPSDDLPVLDNGAGPVFGKEPRTVAAPENFIVHHKGAPFPQGALYPAVFERERRTVRSAVVNAFMHIFSEQFGGIGISEKAQRFGVCQCAAAVCVHSNHTLPD